jgi:hypothetical protein
MWEMFTVPDGTQDATPRAFTFEDLDALVKGALPFHRYVTEDLMGHRGHVAVGGAAKLNGSNTVRVSQDPLPVAQLEDPTLADYLIRQAARAAGAPVPEPEVSPGVSPSA